MSSQAAKRSQWLTRRSRAENCLQCSSVGPKPEERSRARRQRLSSLVCSFLTWLEAPEMFFENGPRSAGGKILKSGGPKTFRAKLWGRPKPPKKLYVFLFKNRLSRAKHK